MTRKNQELYEAYRAGFLASCEGYNGEYPFEGKPMEAVDEVLINSFTVWIEEKTANKDTKS